MLQKLKDIQNQYWLKQFRDVRALGLIAFLGVALMVSWSGSQVIQRNYELQKQISQLQQENAVRQLENTNLKLQNQYFETEEYLELKARQDFGLGRPGEKLVLVPEEVALSYVTKAEPKADSRVPDSQRPAYQRNFEAWIDFFLHRQAEL